MVSCNDLQAISDFFRAAKRHKEMSHHPSFGLLSGVTERCQLGLADAAALQAVQRAEGLMEGEG